MASLESLKKNMEKMKISPEIMAQMNFDPSMSDTTYNGTVRILLAKMEELLTKEQRLTLMEKEGCCKGFEDEDGIEMDAKDRAFVEKYTNKPLAEKIRLHNTEYDVSSVLNGDDTITIYWSGYQNGVHSGKTTCSCPHIIREVKDISTIAITYCGCCAGHMKYHFELALEIKLRLIEIISSPFNTNGEKGCGFLYRIINT